MRNRALGYRFFCYGTMTAKKALNQLGRSTLDNNLNALQSAHAGMHRYNKTSRLIHRQFFLRSAIGGRN